MNPTAARLDSARGSRLPKPERVELDLPGGGIVLVGDNGQGKTNFLEAIYYFQILRSVRGTRDADAVRFGADGFRIGAAVGGTRHRDRRRFRSVDQAKEGAPRQRVSDATE